MFILDLHTVQLRDKMSLAYTVSSGIRREQQRLGSVSGNYTFNLLYGLGLNSVDEFPHKVAKVTRADILATAKKYFQFNREVLSIVRP